MAEQARIIGFYVIGASVRRGGARLRIFGPLHLHLGGAMEAITQLDQQYGGLWTFYPRSLCAGMEPADLLASPVPIVDSTPWKLYAVEAYPYTPPRFGEAVWEAVWGRTAAEARAGFQRRHKGPGRMSLGDIIPLTAEQEQALEHMGNPNAFPARLADFALQNRKNRTEEARI